MTNELQLDPMHGLTANYIEENRFTKKFGDDLSVTVYLEKVVPIENEDNWYHSVRITYIYGPSSGNMGGMRVDPESSTTKDLYKMICDELNLIESENESSTASTIRSMSYRYDQMVKAARKTKLEGEGEVLHEEKREINGITIAAQRLYRNGEYYIEVTYKRPDSDLPILVTHWVEDPRQENYYNMFEEVVSELNKFEPIHGTFHEVLGFLHFMESDIEHQRSTAYFDYMDNKANEAVQEMAKMRILLKGIASIRDIANELWDGEEEQLRANRLYVAIHELLIGGDFLRQYINDNVLAVTESKEISLTEHQLEYVIDGIEHWFNHDMESLISEMITTVKVTDYEMLIDHTLTEFRNSREPLSIITEMVLEQEFNGKKGEEILKDVGRNAFQFKAEIEKVYKAEVSN
jgi:hypothetical protein